ncbi:MAG: MBL fold metallo-hydrolase [Chloroflexota bacterium]|nr:MBL fold metallo-hydrolase [Chloroflexota bacterium]
MKLTFLGTSAAWPSGRHNNVCFVAHSDEAVLFDCGPSILYQLARAEIDPAGIRTAIVSHIHGDHSLGIPMLILSGLIGRRSGRLTICLPESAIEPMKGICTTVYPFMGEFMQSTVEWVPLAEKQSAVLSLSGGLQVRTTLADHGVPVVSSHVSFPRQGRTLAFSGDTAYCERVAYNAEGVDLLVHESNWSVSLGTRTGLGHSTAQEAGRIAALANAKRLALVHTDRELAGRERELEAEAAAEFEGDVLAPTDFTTIDL